MADVDAIARSLPDDASYFGVDGAGATHYYSRDGAAMFVVDGDGVERISLEGTPMHEPYEWARHTYDRRGEWQDLRDSMCPPSFVEPLAEGVAERYGSDVDVTTATAARRVYGRVQEEDVGVEAAIADVIEDFDEPVDSEKVRQEYAACYGGGH